MTWPLSQDYNEAVQSPEISFADAELRGGEVATNALGLPMPCSGNFADVYRFNCPASKRSWAVKCFTRQIPGLQERYQQISLHLAKFRLPFMVDFTFLDKGIQVRGDWYPILKMQWVEGFTLNQFVKDHLDKPQLLDVLCQIWVKLAGRLGEANISHCDLQHGNVLLVPGSKAGSLAVRLVDYDGMCVPSLTLLRSIELGHPSYQHPQRLREGIYGLEVDRFSHLAIYTALRALMVGGASLWERYDNGDNLLFCQEDFRAPAQSAVFRELRQLHDPDVQRLVDITAQAAQGPIDQVPLLEKLIQAPRLPAKGPTRVPVVFTAASVQPSSSRADLFAAATAGTTSAPGKRQTRSRSDKKSLPALMAVGIGLTVLLGGLLAFAVWRGSKSGSADATAGMSKAPTHRQTTGRTGLPSAARSSAREEPDPSRQTRPETKPETQPEPTAELPNVPKIQAMPQLLVVSKRTGNAEIFLVNADGTGLLNLTNNKAEHSWPAWSPDGKKIAFASNRDGAWNVYLMDANGGNVQQLTKGAVTSTIPSWSADGKKMAFFQVAANGPVIVVMDLDGGNVKEVGPGLDPALSPDGKKILFAKGTGKGFRLGVMDLDGTNVQELSTTDNIFGQVHPAWSRDGKKVAWTDMVNGGMDIFVADADGKKAEQLTKLGMYNTYAAWSPDGKQIAFRHSGDGQSAQLYVVDTDGQNQRVLLPNEAYVDGARPAWRPLKTLEKINDKAAEFSKEMAEKKPAMVEESWLKEVAARPAEKQVEAVAATLKERNPGFDGKVTHKIEGGVVTELSFLTDKVTDISPVRALTGLRTLQCRCYGTSQGKLADLSPLKDMKLTDLHCGNTKVCDLSPLKDMKLTHLDCSWTQVADLSPLKNMKLTDLECWNTKVSDLSPLKDMRLTILWCSWTQVADLSPLRGMPLTILVCDNTMVRDLSPLKDTKLTTLCCGNTPVSDLSPLKDMKLTTLNCVGTQVSDLTPLKDMKLTTLSCQGTKASDLSPLRGMPLKELQCDFKRERDADILRSLKSLEKINDKLAAEFWKKVDEKKADKKP